METVDRTVSIAEVQASARREVNAKIVKLQADVRRAMEAEISRRVAELESVRAELDRSRTETAIAAETARKLRMELEDAEDEIRRLKSWPSSKSVRSGLRFH